MGNQFKYDNDAERTLRARSPQPPSVADFQFPPSAHMHPIGPHNSKYQATQCQADVRNRKKLFESSVPERRNAP